MTARREIARLGGTMADEDRVKWDRKWSEQRDVPRSSPSWVAELDVDVPREGRGLDVAAGSGRMALYLARRGLDVTAVDISPVGLTLAREAARDEGVKITTAVRDLERQGLPEGVWDAVACFHYRQPDLFSSFARVLAPGGVLIAEVATVTRLERQPEKPSARWLAERNELLRCCEGLDILYYREGWIGERALARVLARKR
ncbi:MAG: methyltransferase domain-containing protein [Myxococcota bacterium]|nr:methyltransferase domain-containing protein [Myxococcota bacterium]